MLPLPVFAAYSCCSVRADFSRLHLLFNCLITILAMASPASCNMYVSHLGDMYPLGPPLYIPISFNVLPENLIYCLDSFREHPPCAEPFAFKSGHEKWLIGQNFNHTARGSWVRIWRPDWKFSTWNECIIHALTSFPPMSKWKHASWRWIGD